MIFTYPQQALFNRPVPKNKIYAHAKPRKSVKDKFVTQVSEIIWKYKLSPATTNLPPRDGYSEIQVFEIALREQELGNDVINVIDKTIPYPIIFHLLYQKRIKGVVAFKRPAQDASNSWVIEEYFETAWLDHKTPTLSLPVALDIKSLYEQIMKTYIGIPARRGESLESLVERIRQMKQYQRELRLLETKMKSERQFNRKVDLNAHIRKLNRQINVLTK